MKKLILISSVACLTIFAMVFLACNKPVTILDHVKNDRPATRGEEDNILFNNVSYTISDGMLKFESFAKYEQLFALEDMNQLQEFSSSVQNSNAMVSYTEKNINSSQKADLSFIGGIVNKDGIIKIDDYTLLLDFNNNLIYATKLTDTKRLIDAKSGLNSSDILTFPMAETDVIDELIIRKTRGILCTQTYAPSKVKFGSSILTTVAGNQNTFVGLHNSVRYGQYGIYYELNSHVDADYVGTCIHFAPFNNQINYSWVRRCSSVTGSGSPLLANANTINCNSTGTMKCLVYGNVRALKNYNITATITSSVSTTPNQTVVVNIVH
jgi:hypothetical protein